MHGPRKVEGSTLPTEQKSEARERIDHMLAEMKERVQGLKEFQEGDIDLGVTLVNMLAGILAPIIEVLEKYEKIAEPGAVNKPLLAELEAALSIATSLSYLMGPMITDREKMTSLRAKRAPTVQSKNQVIEALARQFRKQDPKRSVRSMALKIGEKVKLKTNTVEKKLAAMGF